MEPLSPLDVHWSSEQTAVLQRLRSWAIGFADLNQHLAAWMGLPGSDATALGHIIWSMQEGRPLTPVELSRHLGMTTGATTVLLNRLETAGHITRSREHVDRRRVALRPTPDALSRATAFFEVAGVEIARAVLGTAPAELAVVDAFLRRMDGAVVDANTRLRQQKGDWSRRPPRTAAGSVAAQ